MGLLSAIERPAIQARAPHDDFWYQPAGYGTPTAAGVSVTPDSALKASAVWACVTLLADVVALAPAITYARVRGGKERAYDHPLYDLLADAPNRRQNSFTYFNGQMMNLLT